MPPRWLDLTDTHSDARPLSAGEQPPTAYIAPSGQQPHITLTQALEQLGIELARDMATEVREDVADALRKMALRRGAQHDQDQVRALLASTPGKRRPAP